jgi:acyl-CoA thioesterase-1
MPVVLRLFTSAYGARRLARNLLLTLALTAGVASAEVPEIVALGDSLTAGYGLPEGDGLVPQLQAWLEAQGVEARLVNAGVSGDTTAGGRARLDWSLTPETDALIVTLGGNDMLRGIAPAEARENLDAILAEATERGLPVLLVGVKAAANYGPDYQAAFDAIFPELAAQYGAALVADFFAPLGAASDPAVLGRLMQADGIHPTAEGVARIVEVLGPEVAALAARAAP